MDRRDWRRWLPWLTLACAGCLPPQIRLPTFFYGSPAAERASYERHDPLPDTTLGPGVSGRPRDGDIQRTEPRRARDATGTQLDVPGTGDLSPSASRGYPNTVIP